jgi:hypothetical protein
MIRNILFLPLFLFCFSVNGTWREDGYVHTIKKGQEYAYKDDNRYKVEKDSKGNKKYELIEEVNNPTNDDQLEESDVDFESE